MLRLIRSMQPVLHHGYPIPQPRMFGSCARHASRFSVSCAARKSLVEGKNTNLMAGIDPEHKEEVARILELAQRSQESWGSEISSFYSPAVIADAMTVLNRMSEIRCIAWGGYTRAERQRIVVGREEVLVGDVTELSGDVIAAVQVKGNFLFDSASHPDFLGACLGTGIERAVIGDILVQGDAGAQIICTPSIVEHLEATLTQVRTVTVKTERIHVPEQLRVPEARVKEMKSVEASCRLDAIASAGFRMSRNKLADMIKAGDVRVNWKTCKKPSLEVSEGDMISASGKGRVEVCSISTTSKGKFIVEMQRFT